MTRTILLISTPGSSKILPIDYKKNLIQSASLKEAMPKGTWESYWKGCSSRSQEDNV